MAPDRYSQRFYHRPPFRQIALPDEFLDAGALQTLHDRYGLSAKAVVAQVKSWL